MIKRRYTLNTPAFGNKPNSSSDKDKEPAEIFLEIKDDFEGLAVSSVANDDIYLDGAPIFRTHFARTITLTLTLTLTPQ